MVDWNKSRRIGLFAGATASLVMGLGILYIGFYNFVIRSAGLLLCVTSAYLVKLSLRPGEVAQTGTQGVTGAGSTRPGILSWATGAVVLMALALSFLFLYNDAVDGYHEVWPVYVFAGMVIVCSLVWSYLIVKLRC